MIKKNTFKSELKIHLQDYEYNKQYCGIVLGDVGLLISLSELYHCTKDDYYLKKINSLLDAVIDNTSNYNYTLGYGVAGLAFAVSLVGDGIIYNKQEWLYDLNEVLEKEYRFMLKNDNLDYFSGATGLLFYFINASNKNDILENLISIYLESIVSSNSPVFF